VSQGPADREGTASAPWLDPNATPFVRIEGLSKRFEDFVAVDRVDLSIFKGELFSILGASGCGKTTLLRMLAGLETPSEGRILIDGADVTRLPPYERPVNMMFQSYALFPHMSVERNIGYGLEREGVPAAQIRERVAEMLTLLQLTPLARSKPAQISGGQSQRVALARALIKRPKVLLLDEPLAALDKKLREHTQFELANVQYTLGITFIVVTHDQEEAMTLSTRIAVMEAGRFLQVATPGEIYENPCNRFVADFIGNINLVEGTIEHSSKGEVLVHCEEIGARIPALHDGELAAGAPVCVALRPEKILISKEPPPGNERPTLPGVVVDLAYFGNRSLYRVRVGGGKILEVSAPNRRREANRYLEWDDEVHLSWDKQSALVLKD